jgi:hypothetical protein
LGSGGPYSVQEVIFVSSLIHSRWTWILAGILVAVAVVLLIAYSGGGSGGGGGY